MTEPKRPLSSSASWSLLDDVADRLEGRTLVAQLRELERQEANPRSCSSPSSARRRSTSGSASRRSWGGRSSLFHGQLKPDAKDEAVEAFRASTAHHPA